MKTKFLLRKGILCGILSLLLWGCFKEPNGFTEPDLSRPQNLTLERARATHEAARNRATRSEGDFGILYSGNLEAWWDGAQYSECDFSESYDVEVIAEKYYEQVHYLPDSTAVRSTVFPRLVVVEERLRERNPTPYVAFYFPDRLTEENYEQDAGEGLLNSLPKEGFSGVIIYTTLKGFPVAASRHEDGRQLSHAFLGDATDYTSLLEEVEKYNRIVENIRIFVGDETRSLTGETDIALSIIGKEAVVITSDGQTPAFDVADENKILPVDWHKLDLTGGGESNPTTPTGTTAPSDGIGDGEAGSSLKDGKYDKNEHIQTTSELVAEILDVIYNDCMGKTLIDAIGTDITIIVDSDSHKNGYDGNEFTIYFGDGNENGQQRPYVLIEELVHAYQHQQITNNEYNARMLNHELEAKACWFYFEKRRRPNTRFTNEYDRQLGSKIGTICFEYFLKEICPNMDINNDIHMSVYELLLGNLRTIPGYYKYTESIKGRHFNNFIQLTKNCPEL